MRPLVYALLALAVLLLAGSWFYPRVEQVVVSGTQRYGPEQIAHLAGVDQGFPLLWVNRWSLADLERDPWIERASVIRHWPDTVSITVWERTPVLSDGETAWALDGTVLPGLSPAEHESLPRLTGWGEPRTDEALELVALLSAYEPRVISYTPEGFDIELAHGSLDTPDVATLERHWAAWTNQQGDRAAVYPWGVSEGNE